MGGRGRVEEFIFLLGELYGKTAGVLFLFVLFTGGVGYFLGGRTGTPMHTPTASAPRAEWWLFTGKYKEEWEGIRRIRKNAQEARAYSWGEWKVVATPEEGMIFGKDLCIVAYTGRIHSFRPWPFSLLPERAERKRLGEWGSTVYVTLSDGSTYVREFGFNLPKALYRKDLTTPGAREAFRVVLHRDKFKKDVKAFKRCLKEGESLYRLVHRMKVGW